MEPSNCGQTHTWWVNKASAENCEAHEALKWFKGKNLNWTLGRIKILLFGEWMQGVEVIVAGYSKDSLGGTSLVFPSHLLKFYYLVYFNYSIYNYLF